MAASDSSVAAAKARLDKGAGEPATGYITPADVQKSFEDLQAGWLADVAALAAGGVYARPSTYAETLSTAQRLVEVNLQRGAPGTEGSWPDRFQFRYETGVGSGVFYRTGGFNEKGEGRFDPGQPDTVGLRAHGHLDGAQTANIVEVLTKRGGTLLFGVGPTQVVSKVPLTVDHSLGLIALQATIAGLVDAERLSVTNDTIASEAVTVNRTATSISAADEDIFSVQYQGVRQTWVNEKGQLRVSNSQAPAEETFKILGTTGQTSNHMAVYDGGGSIVFRIGSLGKVNANNGLTCNNLPVEAVGTPVAATDAATKAYTDTKWTMWSGTQAAYDAIGTKSNTTLYVIV